MTGEGRKRGRRPAGEDTRALILAAAREEFATKGYAAASLRAVARGAGVDPALVHHYFHGKEDLFTATLDAPANPAALLGGVLAESDGLEGVGAQVVATFLRVWDDPDAQTRLRAMLRNALDHEAALQALREYVVGDVLGRIGARMPPEEAPLRMSLVGSQLVGLAVGRYVVGLPGLVSATPEELVASVGPTLQRYLTGPVH